jgi:hypothetical protein
VPLFLSCFLADRRPTPLFLNRYVSMKSDFTFTLPFTPLRPAALQGQGRRQDQLLHLLRGGRGHLQALLSLHTSPVVGELCWTTAGLQQETTARRFLIGSRGGHAARFLHRCSHSSYAGE